VGKLDHNELEQITREFTAAFNEEDLPKVMSYFAEDAIYDEFNGVRREGLVDIEAAFAPQFQGDFGEMRFVDEDLFVDAENQKSLISWECTLRNGDKFGGWRGLDILHFEDGKITQKLTYAKADKLKFVKK
jgi:ketosteroid isomerase-like protein